MAEKSKTAEKAEGDRSLRKDGPTKGERDAGPIADQREIDQATDRSNVTVDRVTTPGS